ncbi:unnamed protein product [Ceratitis capitata]|uniref:(Mediterranean fruit fly) hypothetical protein n=1 Tax=Ceratitis capitata TaxID=7213 RepID=A0A811UQT8_CERCA|nr:unnamed protein product [Ceratitis capitata]
MNKNNDNDYNKGKSTTMDKNLHTNTNVRTALVKRLYADVLCYARTLLRMRIWKLFYGLYMQIKRFARVSTPTHINNTNNANPTAKRPVQRSQRIAIAATTGSKFMKFMRSRKCEILRVRLFV